MMKKFIKYQLEIEGRNINEEMFSKWNWETFDKQYPKYLGVEELCEHTTRNTPIFIGTIISDTSAMCNAILKELKAKLKMNFCNQENKVSELLIAKGDRLF